MSVGAVGAGKHGAWFLRFFTWARFALAGGVVLLAALLRSSARIALLALRGLTALLALLIRAPSWILGLARLVLPLCALLLLGTLLALLTLLVQWHESLLWMNGWRRSGSTERMSLRQGVCLKKETPCQLASFQTRPGQELGAEDRPGYTWARGLLARLMNLFNQLPGFEQSPPGLEHRILQRLPAILLLGTALPVALSLANRGLASFAGRTEESDEKAQMLWDYVMLGLMVTHWMLVIAVGVTCVIVRVMKGPAYVADAYPLPDESMPPPDWR
jgi:hypothetical protein